MRVIRSARRLAGDQAGAVLVEATILIPILFIFTLGAVDFLFAFYQWSAASKAVEVGARLAAVSNPVANGLSGLGAFAVNTGLVSAEDKMPTYTVTCDGSTATCNCPETVCSGAGISYDPAAMQNIVYGRKGGTSCGNPGSYYFAGMCNFYPGLKLEDVKVVYKDTGLGFAGRPGGPIPTITVSVQKLQFQFFFLNALMGFVNIKIPPMTTTASGEVLSSAAQ